MSYIDKYNSNKIWAESAYNDNLYDIATNRYYYSIFQKIKNALASCPNYICCETYDGKGTHLKTIREYNSNCVVSPIGNRNAFRVRTEINTNFTEIKKFRVKADYQSDSLSLDDARIVKSAYYKLDQLIQ